MIEQGIVEKLDAPFAFVRIIKNESCDGCTLCDTSNPNEEKILRVFNKSEAAKGDWVEINISPSSVIKTSLLLFIAPVVALIAGYIIGDVLDQYFSVPGNFLGILTGVLGVVMVMIGTRYYDTKNANSPSHIPIIDRILYPSS